MPLPKLVPVKSSRLAAIGYDEEKFQLYIKFPPTKTSAEGKLYRYFDVEPDTHEAFMTAESQGIFFGEKIVGKDRNNPIYRFEEVIESEEQSGKPELVKKTAAEGEIVHSGKEQGEPVTALAVIPELPEKDEELKGRALATLEQAKSLGKFNPQSKVLLIETGDAYKEAVNRIRFLAAEKKLIEARVLRVYNPAYQTYIEARNLRDEALDPYETADKMLNASIKAYLKREADAKRDREEAERRERERISREEAEAASRVETEKAAQHAEAAGDVREADSIRANPIAIAPKPVAPVIHETAVPDVEGVHKMKENWQYRLLDEAGLPISLDFYTLDPKKLLNWAKTRKKLGTIPGVIECYDEGSLTIKK